MIQVGLPRNAAWGFGIKCMAKLMVICENDATGRPEFYREVRLPCVC